jgi:hypothetical protein
MNLLVDKLPTDYEGLKINTNFRSFILFELLMQDKELSNEEKILLSIRLFYEEEIKDVKKAIEGILWFYRCGEEIKENSSKTTDKSNKKQIYSYEYDAKYIYSAFLDQYGVDLNEIDHLHWFKFKAMFEGLKSDNKICEIMGYRAIDLSKIKDKEEKKKYKRLQRQWALPDNRTIEEKEQDFANSLW